MRVVVSGGGTAGHISPILATVDALKSLDSDLQVLYIGQAGSMEAKIAAASGIEFAAIQAGKFRRMHGVSKLRQVLDLSTLGLNARDSTRVLRGTVSSLQLLRRWKPDVVFVKGGYVGLPVGLAAHLLRIPLVIHESDLVPGLTNRILGRWATRIAVGFPVKGYRAFEPDRLVYTGTPVRSELKAKHRLEGLATFELNPDMPVMLVTGGSQGARAINDCLVASLPQLLPQVQIIHLTGEGESDRVRFAVQRLGKLPHAKRYHPYAFILKEMAEALAAADVVIARAGAQTIAELAYLKKPTILIPNYLHAGHQVDNARLLSRAGAVQVLEEPGLTPAKFTTAVRNLIGSEDEQARLGRAIAEFAKPQAAQELAEAILGAGKRR